MAAVVEKTDLAAKFDSQVDEQLAQATSRIRFHDFAFGGLLLVAVVLFYATAMIVLDKSFVLPEWARQVSLAGFLAVLASIVYFTLISPMRKRINPLYAARQVERTIDDAKNSVTGYVDAQQKGDLNSTVRAALASRAAKAAAEADVNRAVDHRSLIYIGAVTVVLLLTLVVLFFVFRPAQFASLVGRAFIPFSSSVIATQTQLQLVKPDPAEPTITTGQSITVAVHVSGKIPSADGPDRVRLLVRHNPADPNYEELPMVQGETTRDWELRVPDYLVQNGFWYKVAGGDDVTPEYQVTVRSLPMFTDFQATYDYPKYLRRESETAHDPVIHGYRGTTVTFVTKTNREVRDGTMEITPGNVRVPGVVVPGQPDSLQFVFKLAESGRYKLSFSATNGEHSIDPFESIIKVDADQKPLVVITKPESDEVADVPVNGQIKVDGKVGDDFGVDTVTLKMRIVSPKERPLPDVPYLNGQSTSFHREKDDTWPTDLDYKGSVDLAKLKEDATKLPLILESGMVIEYWLEATDNCAEPKPNVGRSQVKKIRLAPPKMEEMDKQQLDQQKQARQKEEQQHNQQQEQKFANEKREPNQKNEQQPPPKPDDKTQNQQGDKPEGMNQQGDKPEGMNPQDKPAGQEQRNRQGGTNQKNDKKNTNPATEKQPPEGMSDPSGMGGMGMDDPMSAKKPNNQQEKNPDNPMNMGGMGQEPQNNTNQKNNTPNQQKVEDTAKEFENQIQQENQNGGMGKPNPTPNEKERATPGESKPQPKSGMGGKNDMGQASEPKPEPQPSDPMNPKGKNNADAASSKPEGKIEKSQDQSTPKPEQNPSSGMKDPKNAPAENRNEPFGGAPGTEKETPKASPPTPKDANTKQDPNSGSQAKPATQKKDDEQSGMPNADNKQAPANAASGPKPPMRDPARGEDKPSEQSKGEPKPGTQSDPKQPAGGEAKPKEAPPAGGTKPKPQDDMMGQGMGSEPKPMEGANEPMKPNGTGAAETKPDNTKNTPMGGGGEKTVDKGTEKPKPSEDKSNQNAGRGGKQKLDEKQMKDLMDAAKDLNSPDKNKQQAARDKLDKAMGKEQRQEMERLAKNLQSSDKDKREAAEKKLKDLKEQMDKSAGTEPKKQEDAKLSEQQKKELTDSLNDLDSGDPNKKQQAQQNLDKMLGEGKRKEIEQFMNDLKSDDKQKQDAAKKKLEDMKKKIEEQARKNRKDPPDNPMENQPSPEEIADLAKKAQDLNSSDSKTREQAENALDEKIGKDNRQKLQEEMKKQKPGDPPMDPGKLKDQLKEWQQGLGQGTRNRGAMAEDKKNRLKTAELNLEHFESDKYRESLRDRKGWTEAEYDDFLRGYQNYVENLRKEVATGDKPAKPGMVDYGTSLNAGGAQQVKPTGQTTVGNAGVGGPTVAPPGFEGARDKFEKALQKKR